MAISAVLTNASKIIDENEEKVPQNPVVRPIYKKFVDLFKFKKSQVFSDCINIPMMTQEAKLAHITPPRNEFS
ncbi:hypothetical protein WICMUC_002896 [Wickerhamomyces mucosus]|uniref:Uncharacterized protein n=1 Tax=Wickerhamomyces mucosus TaxID=1378264 RepID=A0A9P8TDS4_9ASCO|nr:hypothetical protein WICMUC_002896 [Wickerhamomyces mucosus]